VWSLFFIFLPSRDGGTKFTISTNSTGNSREGAFDHACECNGRCQPLNMQHDGAVNGPSLNKTRLLSSDGVLARDSAQMYRLRRAWK